jgi:EpsI family protein
MKPVSLVVIISFLIIGGGLGNYLRFIEHVPDRVPDYGMISYDRAGFFGQERRFSDQSYEILQADTSTIRNYTDERGNSYGLFVAYFASQKYGSQIHSPKHCLPGGGWRIESLEPFDLNVSSDQTITVNQLIISERSRKQLMFYWFQTRGGTIRNEFELKWDLMKNSLLLRPTDAAIIRLTTPVNTDSGMDEAITRVTEFMRQFYPEIQSSLPFSRE